MYGTQTYSQLHDRTCQFENDVKMYGTQTFFWIRHTPNQFENDVKMYGTQTKNESYEEFVGLRMM